MNSDLHEKPTFGIRKRLAKLRPFECRIRDPSMRISNDLNSMDFLFCGKPFRIERRIWKEYQQWHKYGERNKTTDDVKPFPRGDTAG